MNTCSLPSREIDELIFKILQKNQNKLLVLTEAYVSLEKTYVRVYDNVRGCVMRNYAFEFKDLTEIFIN
jgi:hypothetical protein